MEKRPVPSSKRCSLQLSGPLDGEETRPTPSSKESTPCSLAVEVDSTVCVGEHSDEADHISLEYIESLILETSNSSSWHAFDDEVDLTEPRFESFRMANIKTPWWKQPDEQRLAKRCEKTHGNKVFCGTSLFNYINACRYVYIYFLVLLVSYCSKGKQADFFSVLYFLLNCFCVYFPSKKKGTLQVFKYEPGNMRSGGSKPKQSSNCWLYFIYQRWRIVKTRSDWYIETEDKLEFLKFIKNQTSRVKIHLVKMLTKSNKCFVFYTENARLGTLLQLFCNSIVNGR